MAGTGKGLLFAVWDGSRVPRWQVIFDVYLSVAPDATVGANEVILDIRYQLCDDRTCLIPETLRMRVPVEVVALAAESGNLSEGGSVEDGTCSSDEMIDRFRAIWEIQDKTKRQEALWRLASDYPSWAMPYHALARPYIGRADFRGAIAVYRKGLAANPKSEDLHAALADCAANRTAKLKAKRAYIRRFPEAQATGAFLEELASEAPSRAMRINLLQRAIAAGKSVDTKFSALGALCWELATGDPAAAAKLMSGWLKAAKRRSDRGDEVPLYQTDAAVVRSRFFAELANCDRLLKRGRSKAAVAAVEQIKAPEVPQIGVDNHDRELWALMKAKALSATGEHQRAYQELIAHELLLLKDRMLAAAVGLGAQLGKSRRQVESDAWNTRLSTDYKVAEFEVPGPRGRTIKASDYRGRPLLVNAWNPG